MKREPLLAAPKIQTTMSKAPPLHRLRTLSIAAPAYNEAEVIEAFVEGWHEQLRSRNLESFEIVVCNDGSRDATGALLRELSLRFPELRTVTHARNRGGGVAMASAIAETRCDWVLLTDADGQFPPENLDAFERALATSNKRAFLGAREAKRDSAFARLGSLASTAMCNAIFETSYDDFTSACQLVDGTLLRSLHLEARGLNYSLEIVAKLIEKGEAPEEVPIRHLARGGGRSKRTLLKSSLHRAEMVFYLGIRRALLRQGVLSVEG